MILISYVILRDYIEWPGRELNPRHADFQSAALPTELPGRWGGNIERGQGRGQANGSKREPRNVKAGVPHWRLHVSSDPAHAFRCDSCSWRTGIQAHEPGQPNVAQLGASCRSASS